MKRVTCLVSASVLASTLIAGCAVDTGSSTTLTTCDGCCIAPEGSPSVVDEGTADALRAALQDERRAQMFYANVMERHGQVRPFANIVHAEEKHEAVVRSLMERHGVEVPGAPSEQIPAVPGTLRECGALAAQLERDNIAMYDRLLTGVNEPDIRAAFENLRAASANNHLPAFERVAKGSGPTRAGAGQGRRGPANGPGGGGCCGQCVDANQ